MRRDIVDPQTLGEAALQYAGWGWPVLPLHFPVAEGACSCGTHQCRTTGKHPLAQLVPHGVHDASADLGVVRAWWDSQPTANVGIATGRRSGLLVVDVDPLRGGEETLHALKDAHGPLPDTVESLTGGGGRHILFQHPANVVRLPRDLGPDLPGIDLKGDGGYIVAPPSMHASGRAYMWEVSSEPGQVDIASPPPWLIELTGKLVKTAAGPVGDVILEGQRNSTLTSLAGTMRRRGMGADAIAAALMVENAKRCQPPLPAEEVERIALSVGRYAPGMRGNDFAPSALVPSRATSPGAGGVDLLALNCTDSGNAELFAELYGAHVRYDHTQQRWLLWDGNRWREPRGGELMSMAKEAARARYVAASAAEDREQRKWAFGSESRSRIDNVLYLARAVPPIDDREGTWDRDRMLLGVRNGVVDLTTGELRPGLPDDRITLCACAPFDPDAPALRWEQFVSEIFHGDRELIAFTQRAVGYCLTGDVSEQCFFLCHGKGMNGKSQLLNALRYVFGDYAADTPFSTFELRARAIIPNDLAALVGRRVVTAVETSEAARLNEARIKAVTGGDPITCRFLHREFFTYDPVFKLWLACNHRPMVQDHSDGFWRRVRLIPFEVQFRGEREDRRLREKLQAEVVGILAWCVRGALDWYREGLQPPSVVLTATEEYRADADPLGPFIEDCCVVGPEHRAGAAELYKTYTDWCHSSGIGQREMLGSVRFGRQMAERFRKTRSNKARGYAGVGLRQWPRDERVHTT